jgi:hypothetical protein
MLAAARAAYVGMGDFNFASQGFPTSGLPDWGGGSGGGSNNDGGGGNDVPWYVSSVPFISAIGKTVSNIWGNANQQYQQPQYQYQPAYQQQPIYQTQPGGGVGIGLDGAGIRLSDGSHIGWLPIAGVGLGLVLLQSKGFSRR